LVGRPRTSDADERRLPPACEAGEQEMTKKPKKYLMNLEQRAYGGMLSPPNSGESC